MKKKLREVMEYVEYDELVKIRKDILKGGIHLLKLVDDEIRKETSNQDNYCCVCNSRTNPNDVNNYSLIFGPADLRKKASFCAIDCLEYFIKNLKDLKMENVGEKIPRGEQNVELWDIP